MAEHTSSQLSPCPMQPSAGSVRPQPQLPCSVNSLRNVLEDIRTRCIALESNLSEPVGDIYSVLVVLCVNVHVCTVEPL